MAVPQASKLERYLLARLTKSLGFNYVHFLNTFSLTQHPFYTEADVLNFHNLHTDYFNYLALPKLTTTKPAIFTLHDMWSFTGHCTYSYDCDRWKTGCGQCPYPDAYPPIQRDNTNLEWKLKDWVYSHSNLTIVAPSLWLTEQAQQSLLNRFSIHHIPNGIDTEIYQPLDTEQCRSVLGLPTNKYILMMGAAKLNDTRKGGHLLVKALQTLPDSLKSDCLLLILGDGGEAMAESVGMDSLNLGYISSDRLKAIAYSAADLFLFPTRADNLPLVLQESMACGTPMVSFKIGGVPDLVRPDITGYLALSEDIHDFQNGIMQLLEDSSERDRLSRNCRATALNEYSLKVQVKQYIELYRRVLQT